MASFAYEHLVTDIVDYPKPGVVFKDITPLMADPDGFAAITDTIAEHFADRGITKVIGAEARGFMVGAPVAYKLHAGFVPARKPGKLPRETYQQEYELEYGTDTLEIHKDSLTSDDVVLIVDDLLATGGTAQATIKLIEQTGATVAGLGFLMELAFLHPRQAIAQVSDVEIFSLIHVN